MRCLLKSNRPVEVKYGWSYQDLTVRNASMLLHKDRFCLWRQAELIGGNPLQRKEVNFSNKSHSADYSMYSTFLTASPGSVLFSRSTLLKKKGSLLLVPQARSYKAS